MRGAGDEGAGEGGGGGGAAPAGAGLQAAGKAAGQGSEVTRETTMRTHDYTDAASGGTRSFQRGARPARLLTRGEQVCQSVYPPLSSCQCLVRSPSLEVSSSRDSDLGRVGTNSTYPRIHVSTYPPPHGRRGGRGVVTVPAREYPNSKFTGGTETTADGFVYHTFTSDGSLSAMALPDPPSAPPALEGLHLPDDDAKVAFGPNGGIRAAAARLLGPLASARRVSPPTRAALSRTCVSVSCAECLTDCLLITS